MLFSVCTLVTDKVQYRAMRDSFASFGDAEYLTIDNSNGNVADAYSGLSQMLDEATGDYAILCHQDIVLLEDGAEQLAKILAELPDDWAVAGNAGARTNGELAIRISDPHGEDTAKGPFPARVTSLDENFIVVRRGSGIRPSSALSGFHLYGTDLCLQAERKGFSAYVVDFHLRHLSPGRLSSDYFAAQEAFERHWGALLGARKVPTTCGVLTLRNGFRSTLKARWNLARVQGVPRRRAALAALGLAERRQTAAGQVLREAAGRVEHD